MARLFLEGNSLVDRHDRNIVFDRIHEAALFTDKPVARAGKRNVSLAFGTAENVEQFFLYSHL